MEKQLYELTIDPEFADLIPPLQDAELSVLTDSILANGCEMPLVVWNGTIVDGHNRYRVCRENGVPFAVEEKAFDSREAAEIWIIRNQLGRRNLSDFQRCELVLPLEERLKAEAQKRKLSGKGLLPDHVPNLAHGLERTRDALAEMAGVSHGSLDKAKRIMESADEETKDRLRRGELSIHRAYSSLTEGNQKEEKDTEKPASEPVPVKKQEYTSLLKKPIFDHYEPPTYMKPIPFEPIAPTAPPDEPEEAEENTAAERVRELGRAFLDGLDKELKEAEREGLEQILAIVEDVGKKAVQTVKKYCNEHQEEKQP
ncbi:MAG: hypothetical protein E7474_07260 [Ruminococcaceae bacterium]|nr:hypothetical protein [Oscillospiraceae bacterium]